MRAILSLMIISSTATVGCMPAPQSGSSRPWLAYPAACRPADPGRLDCDRQQIERASGDCLEIAHDRDKIRIQLRACQGARDIERVEAEDLRAGWWRGLALGASVGLVVGAVAVGAVLLSGGG